MSRLPVLFVSHGAPDLALEDSAYTRSLTEFGNGVHPRAIVILSAHWEERAPVRVGASRRFKTIHDFGGFPSDLYEIRYPAPGDPDLAAETVVLLEAAGIPALLDPVRGLDHGAWVPLRFLYPAADVPVVPVSLPRPRSPASVSALGRALSSLTERGVLLVGSGGLVHNLARLSPGGKKAPVESWARGFEEWIVDRLSSKDEASLLEYRSLAPHAELAAPTPEHFDPLLFTVGAARPEDRFQSLHEGFEYGTLSLRAFVYRPGEEEDHSVRGG